MKMFSVLYENPVSPSIREPILSAF